MVTVGEESPTHLNARELNVFGLLIGIASSQKGMLSVCMDDPPLDDSVISILPWASLPTRVDEPPLVALYGGQCRPLHTGVSLDRECIHPPLGVCH